MKDTRLDVERASAENDRPVGTPLSLLQHPAQRVEFEPMLDDCWRQSFYVRPTTKG